MMHINGVTHTHTNVKYDIEAPGGETPARKKQIKQIVLSVINQQADNTAY